MKSITGKHRVCGVIGDPICHTLSPYIHNTLAEALGHQSVYVPYHVTADKLEAAIKGAHALGIYGLNITMPHKKEVMQYLAAIDPKAKVAEAVNTLVYTEEGYIGYNTDIQGLGLAMCQNAVDWQDKKVAIIGSGGASYAACLTVIEQAREIIIYNRTRERAEALKAHLEKVYATPITVCAMDDSRAVDIIIQTTGVGMGELKGQMPACTEHLVEHAAVAVDMIYSPWETPFLAYARAKGLQVMNGFDMLYYQAVEAYEKMHACQLGQTLQHTMRETLLKELMFEKH